MKGKYLRYLPLLWALLAVILSGPSGWAAAKGTVVTAIGEAFLSNLTPAEAQGLALKRARAEAIERVCGISMQAESFVQNFTLQGDFIHAVSYGRIMHEDVLKWEVDVDQKSLQKPPELTFRVTIKTEVLREEGEPDPFYKVNLHLNKKIYASGEEMIIKVTPTKPSYITVLNFSADGSVVLLYPNQIRKGELVGAGQKYQIPSESDRRDVLKLQVSTLPGHRKDTEMIKVIATREPLYLLEGIVSQGNYGVMDTVSVAVSEIARLVSSIPLKDRSEETVIYQIVDAN